MDNNEFNEIINNRIKTIKDLLISKGEEYAGEQVDRLHNFNRGAKIAQKSAVEVLQGFMLKHYISYQDIIEDIALGKEVSRVKVQEKLSDMLVYLLLQECVMEETGLLK